jgi:hypothetical protein
MLTWWLRCLLVFFSIRRSLTLYAGSIRVSAAQTTDLQKPRRVAATEGYPRQQHFLNKHHKSCSWCSSRRCKCCKQGGQGGCRESSRFVLSLSSSPKGNEHFFLSLSIGLHFFNPVPVMVGSIHLKTLPETYLTPRTQQKLVELIPALQTSPDVLDRARAFAVACEKGMRPFP